MKKLALAVAAIGLLFAASFAQACSLAAWSATSGAVLDGGPGEANTIARLSGLCAMSATAAGYVQDISPADEPRIIASFYYLATGAGNATLLRAFSDEGGATPIFTVNTNGTTVTVNSNDGGTSASAPAGSGWHLVEVDWNQGGTTSLWVDSDARTDAADDTGTSGNALSTISSVRLGAVGGLGGFTTILFDQYESRRSQAVGPRRRGDAQGDDDVDIFDVIDVIGEIVNGAADLAVGQPDCQLDGDVDIFDAICQIDIIVNGP